MTTNEIRPSAENTEAEETLGGVAFDSIGDHDRTEAGPTRRVRFIAPSIETVVQRAAQEYLASIEGIADLSLSDLRDGALARINAEIQLENTGREGTSAPKLLRQSWLDEFTVVKILLARFPIIKVDLTNGHGGAQNGVLAIYEKDGELEGIYNTDETRIKKLISGLRPSFKSSAVESALRSMHTHAPIKLRTLEPHLIPVANGVFDHARQELRAFSRDLVFLSKIQSAYDPQASSPRIAQPDGTDWEVEDWFQSLSDEEGVPELLWEIVSAALRPFESWNMSAFLVGPKGNGGKGTFLKLIASLLGPAAYTSIPLTSFGDTFGLADLITKNVNLVDENPVGAFATKLDLWKSCVTGDPVKIEEKYVRAIRMRWFGFEVHCLNEMTPRVKDKSPSAARRMLLVLMTKSFTGIENRDIKNKYLVDPGVLRYVLRRALQMRHTSFTVPPSSQQARDRWFAANNKVVGWWEEHQDEFAWDLLPWAFLYDAYKAWYSRVEPSGTVEGFNQFTESLKDHLHESTTWSSTASSVRPGSRMSVPEPLISEFNLTGWMNPAYSGTDPLKRSRPVLKANYKGLLRCVAVAASGSGGEDS
ncbi:phage/plasmid primase, P4 family [Microbacterium sp.]|uniref:DNA primase family protein n=1 Tax=Microbacterium sp. TaxID=51671 RepID=UPI0035B21A4B